MRINCWWEGLKEECAVRKVTIISDSKRGKGGRRSGNELFKGRGRGQEARPKKEVQVRRREVALT